MIIARIVGGLGNQCFQYAVGRRLAALHHTEFKIDLSEFQTYKEHKYSLQHFNIIENPASPEEIAALTLYREKHFHFDPDVPELPDGIYVRGYWQCEKYFRDIPDVIRRELTVKSPLSGRDKEVADQMAECSSVGVHLRRLDYLPNTYKEQLLEVCSLDYYFKAVEQLASSVEDPHFFVFSDDPGWVKGNFKIPYPVTFVDHNRADRNYEDMRLMSLCKHNIIANSTFSWWGAWLNANPAKMVFAPQKWFTEVARSSSKDIIPDSWIKL